MMSRAALGIASSTRSTLPKHEALIKRGVLTYFGSRARLVEHFDEVPIANEKLLEYKDGSDERKKLESSLQHILTTVKYVPIVIDGEEHAVHGMEWKEQILPFNFKRQVARYGHATRTMLNIAIKKTVEVQKSWDTTQLSNRMYIWNKAADLIATKYRSDIVAATMLGQGKTLRQAETDVAELVDLLRISPVFLRDVANYEPFNDCPDSQHNYMRLRGLTGFVAAISPFNYTSIAANLALSPALMGNAVMWKPSDSAILSNWYVFQAMRDAGLPDGVVNFIPCEETTFASAVTQDSMLAGIHFTGTSGVLKVLWQLVANNINCYQNYPRLVGDTGGKNFHFVHSSADPETAVACTIRAAFEYAGQNCSSCSMLYVPASLWESKIKKPLLEISSKLFVSKATYCNCFYSALINKRAYNRIYMWLRYIDRNRNCELLTGGRGSRTRGYFVDPTIVRVYNLDDQICKDELLGPILCVYVYPDNQLAETMAKVAQINHGLIGSVFASDGAFIDEAYRVFKLNVGNLNVNDKSTGAMVAKQPFGAGHMTGTSEKLGSPHSLLRWTSPQVIKESFKPHVNVYYPYMGISEDKSTFKLPQAETTDGSQMARNVTDWSETATKF
ncbi:delta-1-pyrroline-5-carboxylate dehydrogenase, mitochondrial [Drosophila miranda]|uniref:delta-1-pyrroline-5-carboxylate dehydrogenase, mitochondrial n=1 Tax=Drosophila miranda TaxID=7229 RepID=UPI0007E5ECBE|nr:delta-1-pyrroline-5-carboxylate dehydrogenase, mitochondrial [Drosophila miranda]